MRRAFMAIWQDVGYYSNKFDKRNSFQVLLIERGLNTGNFDIEFNYSKIQWETGDASGGNGGIGGSPARAGYAINSTRSNELPGSGVSRAFLDTGPVVTTRLINQRRGPVGTPAGRIIYSVTNGIPN
jgi:Nidogen-like